MSDTNQDKGPLDLTVAKCLIGQRSISRAVYDKTLEDLIQEVEKLREEIDGDNEDLERMFALKASKVRELEARNELSRIAYNQIEGRVEKLKAENAELREKIEDWRAKNLQLELVQKDLQAQLSESQKRVEELQRLVDTYDILEIDSLLRQIDSLKAQLSESQERGKELERLAIKKQWENIKQ